MEAYITSDNYKIIKKQFKKDIKKTKGMTAFQFICYLYPEFSNKIHADEKSLLIV